jgi:hypothetical protein
VTSPLVSVIVPGHRASATLEVCLSSLSSQEWPRERTELVYVDDASGDATPELAARWADRVVRLEGSPAGPASARNAGAAAARGEILVFIDADVVARPGTVGDLVRPLLAEPGLDAVFGSYDSEPAEPGLVSQYRNLLHHHVHQISRGEAETFWAGCGAVRREAFEKAGGFDGGRYGRPSIEDIELGHRMRARGSRIRLVPEIQVKHLKRWTLLGMLRSDVFARGIPWMRLLLGRGGGAGEMGDLNVRLSAMASIPLAWGAVALLAGALRRPTLAVWAAGAALSVVALNLPTYRFFWRARGPRFALGAVPLHFLYHLGNGVSVAGALFYRVLRDKPLPGLAGIGRRLWGSAG